MYLTKFEIKYRPHSVELTKVLDDLGFKVNRDGNNVVVISDNETEAYSAKKQGDITLDALDAEFDSWVHEEREDFEEDIINPYEEYGLTQSMFA